MKSRTPRSPRATKPGRAAAGTVISLTLSKAVLREARSAAKRAGITLDAYVARALERDHRRRAAAVLVADYEAVHGPIGADEVLQAIVSWRALTIR